MAAPYRACIRSRSFQLPIHQAVDAEHRARATQPNQLDFLGIPGFESDCGSGGNVQAHPVGGLAIEIEGAIHFEEMAVGSHLDGTISAIRYGDSSSGASDVGV